MFTKEQLATVFRIFDWLFMQTQGITMSEHEMALSKCAYWSSLIHPTRQRKMLASKLPL